MKNTTTGKPMTFNKPLHKFDFWLENKTAQHYDLDTVSLQERFNAWLPTKKMEWIKYYSSDRIILDFITSKEGLNSVFEQVQFPEIYKILYPELRKFETADTTIADHMDKRERERKEDANGL